MCVRDDEETLCEREREMQWTGGWRNVKEKAAWRKKGMWRLAMRGVRRRSVCWRRSATSAVAPRRADLESREAGRHHRMLGARLAVDQYTGAAQAAVRRPIGHHGTAAGHDILVPAESIHQLVVVAHARWTQLVLRLILRARHGTCRRWTVGRKVECAGMLGLRRAIVVRGSVGDGGIAL